MWRSEQCGSQCSVPTQLHRTIVLSFVHTEPRRAGAARIT